jgi:hypothetical protein
VISQTEFEFYQTVTDDLQHIYHLLNNNMSAFFPTMGGLGQFSAPQTQGGQSTGMTNVYGPSLSSVSVSSNLNTVLTPLMEFVPL